MLLCIVINCNADQLATTRDRLNNCRVSFEKSNSAEKWQESRLQQMKDELQASESDLARCVIWSGGLPSGTSHVFC